MNEVRFNLYDAWKLHLDMLEFVQKRASATVSEKGFATGRKATGTGRVLSDDGGEPQWHAKWPRQQ